MLVQDYHLGLRRAAPAPSERPDLRIGALQPHPVRRARPAAGAARPAPRRAARGHGRAPRLRVPHPPLGRRVRGLLRRRRASAARRRRSCPRSRPTPTTSRRRAGSAARAADALADARRRARRPAADRPGRPHRAVEEPRCAASTPSTTCSTSTPSGAARRVRGVRLPVTRGPARATLAYRQEVEAVVARDQRAMGHRGLDADPLDDSDDFPRSVAALRRSDVLLVNPIRDGLNLVAKEGAAGQRARRRARCSAPRPARGTSWRGAASAGAPLRHRRHRRRAAPGADPRRRRPSGPSARRAARSPRGPGPPRTGWPTRSRLSTGGPAREATRRARRLLRRSRTTCPRNGRPIRSGSEPGPRAGSTAPLGPSTTTSARSMSSAGVSGRATATRTVWTPACASWSSPSNAGRSPISSPRKQTAGSPSASSMHRALVHLDRRVQLDRQLRRADARPVGLASHAAHRRTA